jgi:hypothetical protein
MIKAGATGQEIADYESSQAANDLLGPQGAAWSILNSFGLPSRPRPFTSQRQAMPARRRPPSEAPRTTYAQQLELQPRPKDAASAAQLAKLKEFYRQAEKFGSADILELDSGRFRFYGDLRASRTPGEMAGRRMVREWDPSTGRSRTWHETLDHSGTIRQVRPETGGPKVHYFFDAEGNYGGRR